MSKIEFLALGGLDEKGKNCYILNIDGNIFVINSGAFLQTNNLLGVERTIPDFKYLVDNKEKIRGIFIGTPYDTNYGSLKFLLDELKISVPIYTSNINADIINTSLNTNITFNIVERMNSFDLSGVKITPFKISNCFPNSLGFIFSTNNENVIYTDDSIVCSSKATVISNDILSIIPLISDKNNILLTTVGQVSKVKGFASPSFQTQEYFKDIFNENSSRVIIGLYSFEIYKITSILNAASLTGRTVVFHNSKTADIIKKMGEYKLIDLSKYKIEPISYLLQNPSESIVVIIDQVPNLFFNTMSDICDEQFPELIIGKNDSYYFCSQTIKGYEKKEADLFDTINKCEVKLSSKIDSKYIDLKPGDEDIKFITAFMKPMYIFPVSGLYMEFVNYQNTISKTGFKKKNMIILSNGQNVTFNDGVLDANISFVQLDPKLVNIQGGVDENNSSLLERIQMKDNGAIVIGYIINNNTKKIVDSKYDNIGVVSQPQDVNTLNGIFNKTTTDLSNLLPEFLGENDRLNTKEFKLSVRKNVVSKISKVFDKRPLVMVTILFE